MRRNIKLAGISLAAAAVMIVGLAGPAHADGRSYHFGDSGSVVGLHVKGTLNRVTSLAVSVNYSPPITYDTICNGSARGRGTLTTGSAWSKTWGSYSGCFPMAWSSSTTVNRDFKTGSWIRGIAHHDGEDNSGQPSVQIRSLG